MTSAANAARDARSKKNWNRSLIVIGAVVALAIGAVVFYGTAVLPGINAAKDVAGCKTFLVGYHNAQAAFVAEANATAHTPSAKTAVLNYAEVLHTAANKAYTQSNPDGQLATGYKQISMDYLTIDVKTDAGLQKGFAAFENTAGTLQNMCNTALDNAGVKSPVKTVAPSPTATN